MSRGGLGKMLSDLEQERTKSPRSETNDDLAHRGSRRPGPEVAGAPQQGRRTAPVDNFSDRVQRRLVDTIGSSITDVDLNRTELRRQVTDELNRIVVADNLLLSKAEQHAIIMAVSDDVLGYGPIESFLEDPEVSEIMVNGTDAIYLERQGRMELSEKRFRSEAHLLRVIERIVSSIGRRVDESSPMVDARLADGSRVNAVIAPLAVDGPSLTIRKFPQEGMEAADLIERRSLTAEALTFLEATVTGRLNMLVSGGTGTGKTTFLNVLSSFIPDTDRIVTIEDAVELKLRQRHVIRLECRPANVEGRGAVHIRDLVRNTLRMRPDRIIIGECRGGEALDMLQAMNTGHDGSLSTLHANTPRDAISRLETMVLLTGFEIPQRAIREQLASAVDLVIQLERLRDGRRVVSSIAEVIGMDGDQVRLYEIFALDYGSGLDAEPILKPVGVPLTSVEKLSRSGVGLDLSIFDDHASSAEFLPPLT